MAYIVSARKWRPQTFEEIVGQKAIVKALKSEIENNKIAHGYLFSGPRGIGKTSTARILAKALNCMNSNVPTSKPCNQCANCIEITKGTSIDVLEIDGASNNGVQEARELIEAVKYVPSKSRYKIYIIDEFHMLSNSAFNALLKTLEEPPPHAVFITATTEPHKVLATIKSRMKVFNLSPLSINEIISQLKMILDNEKFTYEDDALFYIAKNAEGGMRDALSILDVILSVSEKNIDSQTVINTLGLPKEEIYFQYLENLINEDSVSLIKMINDITLRGENLEQFAYGLLDFFRNLLVLKKINNATIELVPLSLESRTKLSGYGKDFTEKQLIEIIDLLIDLNSQLRNAVNSKFLFEQYSIKLTKYKNFIDMAAILNKLKNYEEKYALFGEIKENINNDISNDKNIIKNNIISISENFYKDFVDNINEEYIRLKTALHDAKNVNKENIDNGELVITLSNEWLYNDLNKDNEKLLHIAEKEFERIFGKKITIKILLNKKSEKEIIEQRKSNIKIMEDLFGNENEFEN